MRLCGKNTRGYRPTADPDHEASHLLVSAQRSTWLINNNCTFETKEVIMQHTLPNIPAAYYRDHNLEPRKEWLQRYADMVTGAITMRSDDLTKGELKGF